MAIRERDSDLDEVAAVFMPDFYDLQRLRSVRATACRDRHKHGVTDPDHTYTILAGEMDGDGIHRITTPRYRRNFQYGYDFKFDYNERMAKYVAAQIERGIAVPSHVAAGPRFRGRFRAGDGFVPGWYELYRWDVEGRVMDSLTKWRRDGLDITSPGDPMLW